MPINGFLYPGAKVVKPYSVANSCMFDDGSGDNLSASSFGTPTSATTYTLSWWVKKASNGENSYLFGWYDGSRSNSGDILFDSNDKLAMYHGSNDGNGKLLQPTQKFSDTHAWYHMVWAVDTTQGTASNRVKFYVNGTQVTDFSSATYPDQNAESKIFHDTNNRIGSQWNGTTSTALNGYLAEVVFIDGQALTPSSFGEFDDDSPTIWKPIDVSGLTFGNNGFYLDFEDSSALGNDVSGNNNDFTANNLAAVNQSTDTCTNNFATLDFLNTYPSTPPVHSEGSLQVVTVNADPGYFGSSSTIGVTQGKWYAEFKPTASTSSISYLIGVSHDPFQMAKNGATFANQVNDTVWAYYGNNGNQYHDGSSSSYGNSYTTNDIIGVALDLDNHKLYFSKNGTFQNSGDPTSGSTGTGAISIDTGETYFFVLSDAGGSVSTFQANFGSPPFSISSGNADANGHGNFEYSVPSGYFTLCTKNLAENG